MSNKNDYKRQDHQQQVLTTASTTTAATAVAATVAATVATATTNKTTMVTRPAECVTHGVEVLGAVGDRRRLADDALEKRRPRQLHLPQALVVSLAVTWQRDTRIKDNLFYQGNPAVGTKHGEIESDIQ